MADDPVIVEAAAVGVAHRDKNVELPVVFDYTKSDMIKAAMEQAVADGFAADQPVEDIKTAVIAARDEIKGA